MQAARQLDSAPFVFRAPMALPGHDPGVFNLSVGELVMLGLLLLIFFDRKKLPDLASSLGEDIQRFRERQQHAPRLQLLLRRTSLRRWTVSDWLLAISASVAVAAAIANALLLRR